MTSTLYMDKCDIISVIIDIGLNDRTLNDRTLQLKTLHLLRKHRKRNGMPGVKIK